MMLFKVDYSQNIGEFDEWHLKGLKLRQLNLIASRNAIGKTRTVNVINHLAMMLNGKQRELSNGDFDFVFRDGRSSLRYSLRVEHHEVVQESLVGRGRVLLKRSGEKGKIVHFRDGHGELQDFYPPKTMLTNQARRDLKELTYLEDLHNWAQNLHSVTFSNMTPNLIPVFIMGEEKRPNDLFVNNLNLVPYMLEEIIGNDATKRRIISDLEYVGYPIDNIDVCLPSNIPNPPKEARVVRVWEKGLNHPVYQTDFSQGMYRVISIVVAVNYLLAKPVEETFISDDFAEGLDFERATKLAKIVFRRMRNTKTQLILTSNDRFLMNAVAIRYWNILERKGHNVQAFNYNNSKKLFDDFVRSGLNNFDFFANRLYRD